MVQNPSNQTLLIYISEIERMNRFVAQIYKLRQRYIPSSSTNETAGMKNLVMEEDLSTSKSIIRQYTLVVDGIFILINPATDEPGMIYKRTNELVKFTFNELYGEYGKYMGGLLNETGKLILKDNLRAKRLNHLNYRPDKLWRNKFKLKEKQSAGMLFKYGGKAISMAFKSLTIWGNIELYANVFPLGPPIATQEDIAARTRNALISLCEKPD